MRRLLALTLFSMMLMVACSVSQKSARTVAPTVLPDPANATYMIEGRTITLSKGMADRPAAPGSASRHVTTLTGLTSSGDLDGDGQPELAVILMDSAGGSGT